MEQATIPDIIQEADADERAFLESMGIMEPVGDSLSDVESRIDWLMQLTAERHEAIGRNNDVAVARITMIKSWCTDENEIQARQIVWLESKIREHAPKSPEATENAYGKKSRKLPHGTFGFRRTPDTVEITDTDGALGFAESNKLDIKTTRSVAKTTLKAHAKETGECEGDGWRMVEGGDVWFVKV